MTTIRPATPTKLATAIFGAFDGLNTSIGVVLGSAHVPHRVLLELGITVSLTGALSMGAGVMVEDDHHGLKDAIYMGFATLIFTFLLIPPVLLLSPHDNANPAAYFSIFSLAIITAALIAQMRGGTRRCWVLTYTMLALVAIPTALVAVLFQASS